MADVYEVLRYRGSTHIEGQQTVAHYEHRNALRRVYTHPHGKALRAMLEGWAAYAKNYHDQYESSVGDDGVLGGHWQAIGQSLLGLLDGSTGGWDCGSLDANVRELLAHENCTDGSAA